MKKKKEILSDDFKKEFVFMSHAGVKLTSNGNLLIKVNRTTGIVLHKNYLAKIMENK